MSCTPKLLTYIYIFDFQNVSIMISAMRTAVPFAYFRIEKTLRLDVVFIKLFTLKRKTCLLKRNAAAFCVNRHKSCCLDFITFTTGL